MQIKLNVLFFNSLNLITLPTVTLLNNSRQRKILWKCHFLILLIIMSFRLEYTFHKNRILSVLFLSVFPGIGNIPGPWQEINTEVFLWLSKRELSGPGRGLGSIQLPALLVFLKCNLNKSFQVSFPPSPLGLSTLCLRYGALDPSQGLDFDPGFSVGLGDTLYFSFELWTIHSLHSNSVTVLGSTDYKKWTCLMLMAFHLSWWCRMRGDH